MGGITSITNRTNNGTSLYTGVEYITNSNYASGTGTKTLPSIGVGAYSSVGYYYTNDSTLSVVLPSTGKYQYVSASGSTSTTVTAAIIGNSMAAPSNIGSGGSSVGSTSSSKGYVNVIYYRLY